MIFPLLILGIGALAYLSGRHDRGAPTRRPGAFPGAPTVGAARAPSPLLVLDQFFRAGAQPPPMVILCAIAEAEAAGAYALARSIVRRYVAPVVAQAEAEHLARALATVSSPAPGPSPWAWPDPWTSARAHVAPPPTASAFDASAFDAGVVTSAPLADPDDDAEDAIQVTAPAAIDSAFDAYAPIANQEEVINPMQPMPMTRPSTARAQATQSGSSPGTITVLGKSSPIEGIGTREWSAFVNRVSRELPTFTAARHVGMFRARRDRLRELGIDADQVLASADAQVIAFHRDMADAYQRAQQSGMLDQVTNQDVEVAVDGVPRRMRATLSGVLGVIQAAGLEGALGWFRNPHDRVRFPHTTQAFLRTNDVF